MSIVESTAKTPYFDILDKIAQDACVILDGANATELQKHGVRKHQLSDTSHWGFGALDRAPQAIKKIHLNYLNAGADIITTNTYAILEAPTYI